MKKIKTLPYILLGVGLVVLFYVENFNVAGVCIILGIVMILERIWPSVSGD